jgi:hypothetical protein
MGSNRRRSPKANHLENVFEGALGCTGCGRFHHDRGLGEEGISYLLSPLRHGSSDPTRLFRGLHTEPDESWMKQIARNLTDAEEGFLKEKRYLLMDRDSKFCAGFR